METIEQKRLVEARAYRSHARRRQSWMVLTLLGWFLTIVVLIFHKHIPNVILVLVPGWTLFSTIAICLGVFDFCDYKYI